MFLLHNDPHFFSFIVILCSILHQTHVQCVNVGKSLFMYFTSLQFLWLALLYRIEAHNRKLPWAGAFDLVFRDAKYSHFTISEYHGIYYISGPATVLQDAHSPCFSTSHLFLPICFLFWFGFFLIPCCLLCLHILYPFSTAFSSGVFNKEILIVLSFFQHLSP